MSEETKTGLDLYGDDHSIVAMHLNGEICDLCTPIPEGATVEPVTASSPDGLTVIRHSAAHVTAQALQEVIPEAKLGIGPPITDGFYYDFAVRPLSPDDLKAIEKVALRIVKERQRFVKRLVDAQEARAEEAGEPYKLELITDHENEADAQLTMYDNVRRDGSVAWKDLCRGPHVPHTGYIPALAITRASAAYWRGDQNNDSLQRVYGTAWASLEDLKAYQARQEEAARRDHRRLGIELDLFSFPEELGPGLPVFHPKGGIIKRIMEDYVREAHIEAGFSYVGTPHIAREQLYHTSGHLPYFGEFMFPAIDDDGDLYRLKAMNCPMHNLIFRSRQRSYRELPLRLFEFGTVYRNEKSGVLQGLTRVRMITQDDSHSYVMADQAADEVRHLLNFILKLLRDFGLNDFYVELSTRDEDGKKKDKFIGSDEDWAKATSILEQVALEAGLEVVPDPGGAAYYGPKVSVQAKDAIGRTWQMSTIQYDFNQPERFELEYTAPDGSHQRPVMIHSAKFGSIERFMGVLTEHYAGAFPAWLSPVQVVGIPVAAEFNDYVASALNALKARGVRVELDDSDERMQKKIRNATKQKTPFILIAGATDEQAGTISFRFRDGSQQNGVPLGQAVEQVISHIEARSNADPTAVVS